MPYHAYAAKTSCKHALPTASLPTNNAPTPPPERRGQQCGPEVGKQQAAGAGRAEAQGEAVAAAGAAADAATEATALLSLALHLQYGGFRPRPQVGLLPALLGRLGQQLL